MSEAKPKSQVVIFLWGVAFGIITGIFNPDEKVNPRWLIIAATSLYTLAFRFYGKFFSTKILHIQRPKRIQNCDDKSYMQRRRIGRMRS